MHALKDVLIPKAHEAKAVSLQETFSLKIAFALYFMNPAIDLDDQHHLNAHKISNKRTNRHLPAEFPSVEALGSEALP